MIRFHPVRDLWNSTRSTSGALDGDQIDFGMHGHEVDTPGTKGAGLFNWSYRVDWYLTASDTASTI